MAQKREFQRSAYVDAEPFRALVQKWLDAQDPQYERDLRNQVPVRERVWSVLWPDACAETATRKLHRFLSGEQKVLHFDDADRIVCKLFSDPGLWHQDERLAEIYQNANLFSVDVQRPTCEEAERETVARLQRYRGMSPWTVSREINVPHACIVAAFEREEVAA